MSPYFLGVAAAGYLPFAIAAGAGLLVVVAWGFRERDKDPWARRVFFASLPQLLVVFAALAYFSH